jgi:hypothetical protein
VAVAVVTEPQVELGSDDVIDHPPEGPRQRRRGPEERAAGVELQDHVGRVLEDEAQAALRRVATIAVDRDPVNAGEDTERDHHGIGGQPPISRRPTPT